MSNAEPAEVDRSGSDEHLATLLPVIATMREQSHQAFKLDDLAEMAYLSRFHFNRVFSTVAGCPPVEFMTALRFDRAKQLLLTTDLSVTDVCFEVGFSSLGTFSTRFTHFVGLSPAEFRRLPELIDYGAAFPIFASMPGLAPFRMRLCMASVIGLADESGPVYVGLFPTRFARGRPMTGTLLEGRTASSSRTCRTAPTPCLPRPCLHRTA
ncbi:MAG: helix-turn-helix transcriptional regulator [Thermomicrobiales bacterium]